MPYVFVMHVYRKNFSNVDTHNKFGWEEIAVILLRDLSTSALDSSLCRR